MNMWHYLITFAYAMVAGFVGAVAWQYGIRRCEARTGKDYRKDHQKVCGHNETAVIGGVFWFLFLPVALGVLLAVRTTVKEERALARRNSEAEEVKHLLWVASQRALEAEHIDRQYRAAIGES